MIDKVIFAARGIALNVKSVMSFQAWMRRVRGGCRTDFGGDPSNLKSMTAA